MRKSTDNVRNPRPWMINIILHLFLEEVKVRIIGGLNHINTSGTVRLDKVPWYLPCVPPIFVVGSPFTASVFGFGNRRKEFVEWAPHIVFEIIIVRETKIVNVLVDGKVIQSRVGSKE